MVQIKFYMDGEHRGDFIWAEDGNVGSKEAATQVATEFAEGKDGYLDELIEYEEGKFDAFIVTSQRSIQ